MGHICKISFKSANNLGMIRLEEFKAIQSVLKMKQTHLIIYSFSFESFTLIQSYTLVNMV